MANPAYQQLEDARRAVVRVGTDLRHHLDAAVRAMGAQAWVSSEADSFSTGLHRQRRNLDSAADGAIADIDAAMAGTPETLTRTQRVPQ